MKQTSIDKLSQVYNYLTDGLGENGDIAMANLIKEVLRAEGKESKQGNFNLYDYTAPQKEYARPALKCIFHEKGYKVACDAHIMVALKEDYPADYEGKMLKADGSFEECCKYPQWQTVIPKGDGRTTYKVDATKFYEWINERRAVAKAEFGKGKKWLDKWAVKVGPTILKAYYFDKLLIAMKRLGTDDLLVGESHRAVLAKSDGGCVILMPVMKDDYSEMEVLDI